MDRPALRGRVAAPKRSIGIWTLRSFRLMARPRPGRRLLSLPLLVLQIQSFQLPNPKLHAAAAQSSRRPHGAGNRRGHGEASAAKPKPKPKPKGKARSTRPRSTKSNQDKAQAAQRRKVDQPVELAGGMAGGASIDFADSP